MIISKSYDVEVLPNFFSVTITDVASYLETFKDCVAGKKNKPVPLTQKLTVTEIKRRLDKVDSVSFYITDTNDSQLFAMLEYLNNMTPHFIKRQQGDAYVDVAVRTDMFGYNSNSYDRLMISGLLMFATQVSSTKELITKLYDLSKHIISLQDDKEARNKDYFLNTVANNRLPFVNIDIMTIFALNKVGSGVDDKGNTIYFGKSLKQTSINLQWYELLEYELPPISEKDVHFYTKNPLYESLSPKQIDSLVNKWDRYILDEWIPPMMHYNKNDVFIVCEMIRLFIDEIRLRYSISNVYKVDVLSSSRSNIADKLFIKFYSEFSGLHEKQWRGKKTERTALAFKRVIFPIIKFKTKELQDFLNEIKQVVLYSLGTKALKEVAGKYPNLKYLKTNTKEGWFEIKINNLVYTVATGGLHSKDKPRELKSKIVYLDNSSTWEIKESNTNDNSNISIWDKITDDSYIYVHADVCRRSVLKLS